MKRFQEAFKEKKALPAANNDHESIDNRIVRRVLDLATSHPRTGTADKALIWLVSTIRVNRRPEAETALTILARDYAASDRLKDILFPKTVLYWWSSAAENLLRSVLATSGSPEVRGRAAFQLAELLVKRAEQVRRWQLMGKPSRVYVQPPPIPPETLALLMKSDPTKTEDEAGRLFERVIAEFPGVTVTMRGDKGSQTPLAGYAKVLLWALRRFSVGKVAPEIQGVDLDGKSMKLSDYRGKVVVLDVPGFFTRGFVTPDQVSQFAVKRFRDLGRSIEAKPVAILGMASSHRDEYRKEVEEQHVPIRFWWDPEDHEGFSKIQSAWSIHGEHCRYVLDRDGVIRFKLGPDRGDLEKAVSVLLDEMAERDRSAKQR